MSKDQIFVIDPQPQNKKIIILLHGLGSDSSSWQLQFDALISQGFRPIAVDVPGFGKSDFTFHRWTIRRAALMIVRQVIEPLDEPVMLIGLSLGGVIAQKIVQICPQKVTRIILVSTFARLHPKLKKNLPYLSRRILQVFSGNIRKQAVTVADRIFPLKEQKIWHDYLLDQIKNANPVIYRQAMISLAAFNSRRWMKRCAIPCLVITGEKDSTVTAMDQKRLANLIPQSTHIVIAGGGHAVNVDHFEEFNSDVIRFLNKSE